MSAYDVIYMLKPKYEDKIRGGEGWWKLQWKPIWKETYSAYLSKGYNSWRLGLFYYNSDARNGWHRSYKHRTFEIYFFKWSFSCWIRYDFMVHKDGPSDMGVSKPLVLPGSGSNGIAQQITTELYKRDI